MIHTHVIILVFVFVIVFVERGWRKSPFIWGLTLSGWTFGPAIIGGPFMPSCHCRAIGARAICIFAYWCTCYMHACILVHALYACLHNGNAGIIQACRACLAFDVYYHSNYTSSVLLLWSQVHLDRPNPPNSL